MLASGFGAASAMVYTWWTEGKPNPGMMVNGMLAGLVAITAPSGYVGPIAGSFIGLVAGVLVCLAAVFIEKKLRGRRSGRGDRRARRERPVGGHRGRASSPTGRRTTSGLSVTGLLYGNVGQFVAQLIGAAVCFAWAFGASYVFFKVLNRFVKLRVSADTELQGLDIPEMGSVGYVPEDLPLGEIFPKDRLVIPPMPSQAA